MCNQPRGVDGTLREDGDESDGWTIRKIIYSLLHSVHHFSSCVLQILQRIVRRVIHKFTAWAWNHYTRTASLKSNLDKAIVTQTLNGSRLQQDMKEQYSSEHHHLRTLSLVHILNSIH